MEKSASPRRRGRAPLGPRIFGGGALLVGALAFTLALSDLNEGRDAEFTPVNAAFAPLIITGLWVLFAAIYFVKQLINPYADYPEFAEEPPPARTDDAYPEPDGDDGEPKPDGEPDADQADAHPADVQWKPAALVAVALMVYVLLLDTVGFVLLTPLFFVAITWIFGSRKIIRDVIVAVVLTVGTYLLFTSVLGLTLAEGLFAP
ncbi:tripartite tricarboxylate transporter TctB family protein [Stackebrandtia nassauensis]|uniref:DUF1468 domain-containing protein n=1 Tax=Stackebrandtia nassauensis (strain DSM 44728 / CIP 108903 / NRRL B-16338 / NBRC 102104 / LLR-40K-21) TaxID=446470 RepID=D3QAJ1_STANL|nr:tripartite tricarboxylate transporter TctB family protein [Stackebrandtia nassauensis]ADD42774.1 hypothetical protein Snas_3103 [Stackebrandtia nassauensis DSM 44728]